MGLVRISGTARVEPCIRLSGFPFGVEFLVEDQIAEAGQDEVVASIVRALTTYKTEVEDVSQ